MQQPNIVQLNDDGQKLYKYILQLPANNLETVVSAENLSIIKLDLAHHFNLLDYMPNL